MYHIELHNIVDFLLFQYLNRHKYPLYFDKHAKFFSSKVLWNTPAILETKITLLNGSSKCESNPLNFGNFCDWHLALIFACDFGQNKILVKVTNDKFTQTISRTYNFQIHSNLQKWQLF